MLYDSFAVKLWSYLPPVPLLRQYAAKYDPKIPGADVDRALDEAAGRLFDSHSPGAFGAKGYSGFGSYGAASEPEMFGRARREGICCWGLCGWLLMDVDVEIWWNM